MADDARAQRRLRPRILAAVALLAGVVAVVVAMVTGLAPDLVARIATPPALVRAGLSGFAIVLGGRLLFSAVRRIDSSIRRDPGAAGDLSDADLGTLVRGVRLVFLAVASFTAAAGWILGEPLPLVIALVIAGVDVVETSFLLLVTSRRGSR
jgi:predicted PurR-regulated permease PerM